MLWSVPDIIRDCFLCWPYVDNTDLLIDEKQHFPGLFVYHVVYPGSFLWGQVTHHGFHLLPSQSLESLLYSPLLLLYVTMEYACNSTTKQFSDTETADSRSVPILIIDTSTCISIRVTPSTCVISSWISCLLNASNKHWLKSDTEKVNLKLNIGIVPSNVSPDCNFSRTTWGQ